MAVSAAWVMASVIVSVEVAGSGTTGGGVETSGMEDEGSEKSIEAADFFW